MSQSQPTSDSPIPRGPSTVLASRPGRFAATPAQISLQPEIEPARPELFTLIDARRSTLFINIAAQQQRGRQDWIAWIDEQQISWVGLQMGTQGIAATSLGPGWVWERCVRGAHQDEFQRLMAAERNAFRNDSELGRRLLAVRKQIYLGGLAARALWTIHRQALAVRSSAVILPDQSMAAGLWSVAPPRNWLKTTRRVVEGLRYLHFIEAWPAQGRPVCDNRTVLLYSAHYFAPGAAPCDARCPGFGGPQHGHFCCVLGPAWMGVLDQFATKCGDEPIYSFDFPAAGQKVAKNQPTLRSVGRSKLLTMAYLPAVIGSAAPSLSPSQHQLLQATVREISHAKRAKGDKLVRDHVIVGNRIPDIAGRKSIVCALLDPAQTYITFGGNRLRRGHGYRLTTPGGWIAKAGYPPIDKQATYSSADVQAFVADLAVLADRLALTVVGVGRRPSRCYDLAQMAALARTPVGAAIIDRLHLRIYARPDWRAAWAEQFGTIAPLGLPQDAAQTEREGKLLLELAKKKISKRALARGIGVNQAYLSRILAGRRRWPDGTLDRALGWAESQPATPARSRSQVTGASQSMYLITEFMKSLEQVYRLPRSSRSSAPLPG